MENSDPHSKENVEREIAHCDWIIGESWKHKAIVRKIQKHKQRRLNYLKILEKPINLGNDLKLNVIKDYNRICNGLVPNNQEDYASVLHDQVNFLAD